MNGKPKLDASSMRLPQNKMIELDSVAMQWDNHVALQNVSLSIDEGDFVAITGPNGGGKTTLLRLLLGVVYIQDGELNVCGDGHRVPVSAATRHLFSYVPQDNTLFAGTVAENLRLVKPDATEEELDEVLKIVL